MKKAFYILMIGALITIVASPVSIGVCEDRYEKTFVFTTPLDEGVFTQYQKKIFQNVYERTGINCRLIELPKKRCLIAANKGIYTGVAARVKGLEKDYPNLRMINVSHFTVQHILFALKNNIINTVYDINTLTAHAMETGCIVGFLRGSKKAQRLLSTLPEKNKIPLDSPKEAFNLIEICRIGAYLGGPGIVNRSILKKEFNQSQIQEVCVLAETRLFPYVHKNYAYAIPILEKALQSMVDDGTLKRIRNQLE